MKISDCIWPRIGKKNPDDNLKKDREKIKEASWNGAVSPVLEEAQRTYDYEMDRSKVAETKSLVYLTILLTYFPIIFSYVDISIIERVKNFNSYYFYIIVFVLFLFLAYTIAAFTAFVEALKLRSYHFVGAMDLVNIKEDKVEIALTRQVLENIRKNSAKINYKLTCSTVLQMRVFRSVIVLSLLFFLVMIVPTFFNVMSDKGATISLS